MGAKFQPLNRLIVSICFFLFFSSATRTAAQRLRSVGVGVAHLCGGGGERETSVRVQSDMHACS